jgi:hypothetical protein
LWNKFKISSKSTPTFVPGLIKMQMKQLVIVFFFLLQYVSGYGQGKITGIIVDSLTQKPIEYVNIALYQKSDGKFTAGVITDMSGEFVINDIAYNEYLLKYSFIGYEKTGFKEIRVDKNNPVIDLGFIELTESPHLLDEVEVTAGRSRFVAKIDRKVFHAGGDLISSSGSVSDLLQNIPSIQVDIDGNISLRGSGNVQILVNGKTSSMMSATSRATVLQQIPANTIDRIEIITNPSAQYKPDGTSGIINIILKKDRQKGFNGTILALFTKNCGSRSIKPCPTSNGLISAAVKFPLFTRPMYRSSSS